jgi:acetylornithine deacetylase/succinyl-diaminopimelate desuccinylase-like protein
VRLDAMGNLIAEKGSGKSGRSMMLVTHAMNQPPNTMPDPYGGKVIDATQHGLPGEAVLGKGASEQKGTMAAMLHAIEAVRAADLPIEGRLFFICCVSGETGRHDAIRNVVEKEGVRAEVAFVYGNSLKLQLGNRGRVDVKVIVRGTASHSSRPNDGANAVTGAMEVLRRLAAEIPSNRSHPQLGTAWLTCNRIESFPRSTHTVQDRCEIGLDRRLLPGEDADAAVAEIARVVQTLNGWKDPVSGKPLRVEVEKGAVMYPSLVTEDSPVVRLLKAGCEAMLGAAPETFYGQSAHDQGYLNAAGIPTANFGSGEQAFAHTDLDMASVDRTFAAARVYAWMIASYLGEKN